MVKIVNVHIPKTGGSSFLQTLSEHYRVIHDYGNKAGRNPKILINEANIFHENLNPETYSKFNCISGHILPIKYKKLKDLDWKFITWLREPSQKLYSQYFHLKRKKVNEGTIGEQIAKNKYTVEQFVLSPICKNYYQRYFFDFPKENFYFIGITENYETDLKFLSNVLGVDLKINFKNKNPNKTTENYNIDSKLLEKIKTYHSEDYKLYYDMLEISEKRK